MTMRRLCLLALLLLALAGAGFAQSQPGLCSGKFSPACDVPAKDQQAAYKDFERGLKLQRNGRNAEAFDSFRAAAELVPRNVDYATAREITRQALVNAQVERGNTLLASNHPIEAMAAFRQAVALDPENAFATQRLRDAALEFAPQSPLRASQPLAELQPGQYVQLAPQPGVRSFHLRTDTRSLVTQVASQFGVIARLEPQVAPRPARFDLDNVDFATAMDVAVTMAKAFWTPISDHEIRVAPDDPQSRQQFERFALQTIYVPGASTPAELTEITSVLRAVFETRFLSISTAQNAVVLRAPRPVLDEAVQFIHQLAAARPEVMLDLRVYEVNESTLRQLGVDLPLQFTMFNLTAAALTLGTGTDIQALINQLISSGAINQANVQGIQALLAQQQNSQLSSIFKNPFASFGGGITRFGVGIPPATLRFSLNQSSVRSLQHLTLRARQGDQATFRLGSRFPILNASFAPIFNSQAISQVLGNNSFIAPFPSFSYEDIGLTVKATPLVHGDTDVTLKLETLIRALGSQSMNGVPVISNREYSGVITVKNGETAVVIGSVSQSDSRTLSGVAGLTRVPVLGAAVSTRTKNLSEDELIITITPHIVRAPEGNGTLQVLAR